MFRTRRGTASACAVSEHRAGLRLQLLAGIIQPAANLRNVGVEGIDIRIEYCKITARTFDPGVVGEGMVFNLGIGLSPREARAPRAK